MSSSGAAPAGGPPSGAAGGDLAGVYPAPSVAQIRGVPVSAVAPTNGQLFQLVGGVWTPASLVIPAPAASVTGPDAFGAASAVGVSTAYARQDHDHGLPVNPAPAPSGLVTGPDAFGDAAAVGVSAAYSRGDHNHGLPANPSAPFAVPAIALGAAAAAGVSGSKIRADATIAAFDATVPVTQALGDAAAVGVAVVAARRDHRHGMPALASTVVGPDVYGAAAVVGVSATPARADHDHGLPAAPSASLTNLSGSIGANVTLPNSVITTILTTGGLGIGTWLVTAGGAVFCGASGIANELWLDVGTATATFSGRWSAVVTANVNQSVPFSMACIVTVTAAGTLTLKGYQGSTASQVQATTGGTQNKAGTTGYAAVKVA